MNEDRFRPGQLDAFNVCIDRLTNQEQYTAIVLPTRYGKSDLIRLVSFEARQRGLISGAIAFSPYSILTRQLIKQDKVNEMTLRYGLNIEHALKVRQLKSFSELRPFSNQEYLLSANIQLAHKNNIDNFLYLVDFEQRRTNLPLLLIVDECHFVSEDQRWGQFFDIAVTKGCLLIFMTATPVREDGSAIPGFQKEIINEEDERRWITYDAGDGVNNKIDVWDGIRSLVELVPNHKTTFKEAWDEDPAPLCHLSREIIDIDIHQNGDDTRKLSELPDTAAMKELSKIVRDHTFIEQGVRKMLEALAKNQRVNRKCAAIVFTGNDQSSTRIDNEHAKKVRRIIENCADNILGYQPDVAIITMKEAEDDDASKAMERFVGNESRDGRGDILIVKQMAGAGLDCPRLKVMLDLSTVRTVTSVIQRMTRAATPFDGIKIADIITPDDPRMRAIWQRFVVEEGGSIDRSSLWTKDTFIKSYLKPKEPGDPESAMMLGDAGLSGYDDSHGNIGNLQNYPMVQRFIDEFPTVGTTLTKADISKKLMNVIGLLPMTDTERTRRNLDRDIIAKREEIADVVKNITTALAGPYIFNKEKWSQTIPNVWRTLYDKAVVPHGIELNQIVEYSTLTKLLEFANQLLEDIVNKKNEKSSR